MKVCCWMIGLTWFDFVRYSWDLNASWGMYWMTLLLHGSPYGFLDYHPTDSNTTSWTFTCSSWVQCFDCLQVWFLSSAAKRPCLWPSTCGTISFGAAQCLSDAWLYSIVDGIWWSLLDLKIETYSCACWSTLVGYFVSLWKHLSELIAQCFYHLG